MLSQVANVLDPIHDTLDPRVWEKAGSGHPVLKPKHAHWIKKSIYSTLDQAGYTNPEQWLTLCFTGSLTTYQYSDDSDADVSLFVDSEKFPEWSRAEMIGLMVSQLDEHYMPGTPYPLQAFVIPEGVKPHDIYRPGLRSAYDIDNNKWIVAPEKQRIHDIESEENGFYSWALQMADKMERLLRYEPKKAVDFWHAIHRRRRRDMQAGKGDTAESNIVYKFLAQRGLLPQIAQESGEYIASTKTSAHRLEYDRAIHPEGKGLLFTDGSMWTWPTKDLKPPHMRYNMEAKSQGLQTVPGSAFAIKEGKVWQFGAGRSLNPQQQAQIQSIDPRLEMAPSRRQEELNTAEPGFGHGQNVLDILERQDKQAGYGGHARDLRPRDELEILLREYREMAQMSNKHALPLKMAIKSLEEELGEHDRVLSTWQVVAMPYDEQFINELKPEHTMEKGDDSGEFLVPTLHAIHPTQGEVGHLQYTTGDEENPFPPGVLMLRTHEPYKRKGIATWMMDKLQEHYPDQPIDMGGYSDSGREWARAYQGDEGYNPATFVKDLKPLTEYEFYHMGSTSLHELVERIFTGVMEGGITLNLAGEEPTARYGFAPDKSSEERISLQTVTPHDIEAYIQHHLRELSQPGKYVGAWIAEGDVWLDVTESHEDLNEAYKRAWNGNQRALYDSVAEEDIPVRDSGIPPIEPESNEPR